MATLKQPSAGVSHDSPEGLSPPAYFACVLAITVGVIGAWAWLRPSFRTELALLSGLSKPATATPDSFYSVRVAPILDAHCNGCHGATRAKGDLRLDTYGYLSLGGRHGAIVQPGDMNASELLRRVSLPPGDPKAMPPTGKASLSADEVTILRLWIQRGASPTLRATAVREAPPLPKVVAFQDFDPAQVTAQRAPLSKDVQALQLRFPGVISYVSRGSADLQVNASLMGASFGDAELALLAPVQDRILLLDASRTGITDASAARISAMRRLHTLRLTGTSVGSRTAAALAASRSLQDLTTVGTKIQPGDLKPLQEKGVRIYASVE